MSLFGLFNHAAPQNQQGNSAPVQNQPQQNQVQLPAAYRTADTQPTQTTQTSSHTSNPSVSNNADNTSTSVTTNLPATGSAWLTTLPLGDYKYTTSGPKQGYIYVCHVASGGGGAQGNPTWISGSAWYPGQKVAVSGSVSWPSASYSTSVSSLTRTIISNGEPTDHNTGTFPITQSDPAHQFDANPNRIKAQNYSFSLPASPTLASSPSCIYGQVGIMNDGVPLFDGFDAEYRDAVAHETQDAWEGHPDESGEYHYHGFAKNYVTDSVATVVGFAFDGFPITGSKMPDGTYLHTADLDECHGVTSAVNLDGKTVTTYHYVLTQDFPYSVSCFKGKSYEPKPGPSTSSTGSSQESSGQAAGSQTQQGSQTQNGNPPTPPAAAISACSGKSWDNSCSFSTPNGTVNGSCQTPPNQSTLACVPNQ